MLKSLTPASVRDIIAIAESGSTADLYAAVNNLEHDARMELMALMWIGRDFDGGFEDALEHARKSSDDGDSHYIAEKRPALPSYLRKGLELVG